MEELILTMMASLEDFNESDLNFTKKDVDKLVKKHFNFENLRCNELGWIILFENGYITQDKFADLMGVYYKDGNYWLSIDSFDEILNNDYEYEISILNGEDLDYFRDCYDADVSYNWDKYTEETLKDILEYCIKKKLEFDEELITKDNTKIVDGKLYFKDEEFDDIIDDDGLDELKTELNNALCDVQDSADRDEVYNKVINAFENGIGYFKRENVKQNGKDVEKIMIKLDVDISEVKSELKEWNDDYDFDTEYYGSLEAILSEMEYFNFDKPYYDHIYGNMDDDYLNEITRDRLSW